MTSPLMRAPRFLGVLMWIIVKPPTLIKVRRMKAAIGWFVAVMPNYTIVQVDGNVCLMERIGLVATCLSQ